MSHRKPAVIELPNNRLHRTALRAAFEPERYPRLRHSQAITVSRTVPRQPAALRCLDTEYSL